MIFTLIFVTNERHVSQFIFTVFNNNNNNKIMVINIINYKLIFVCFAVYIKYLTVLVELF